MKNKSLIFTIFGGTGNLTYNKLIPAFYELFKENKLPDHIVFLAIGRRDKDEDSYRLELREKLKEKLQNYSEERFEQFKKKVIYYKMNFSEEDHYADFRKYMDDLDLKWNTHGNRVFYFATAPTAFPTISEYLKGSGLLEGQGFKRAVFEKPFGYDLESAKEINSRISNVFGEENIYRIDHYLGKEMIQNILTIRFTNQIFKSVWNKDSIDNVQITVKEKNGVEGRGGYYDQSGALRDMVQNHLFQILALIAMEPPQVLDTKHIRDEKVKVLKNIRIKANDKGYQNLVFGQYKGYLQEERVAHHSTTETYVALKCKIDHPRWEGVPFYLRTGKLLDGQEAQVIVQFKNPTTDKPFQEIAQPNLLVIKIQPEEGIYFRINTKKPRSENELMPVSMDYCQSCNFIYKSPEAYERLLYDIIMGDSTLFTRWDEVEAAWSLIKDLLGSFKKTDELFLYEPGTKGPEQAECMVISKGRKWWDLEDLDKSKFDF